MKKSGLVLLVALGVVVITSCSRLPRSPRDEAAMGEIRQQYLENYPDRQFNDHIMRGEVVKGMNIIEVLASWGLPNIRRSWVDRGVDNWTYYAKDEHTETIVGYELIFEDRLLRRWTIDKDANVVGGIPTTELTSLAPSSEDILRISRESGLRDEKGIPRK